MSWAGTPRPLSHVYYEDQLYNGFPADSVSSLGAYYLGIDKVVSKGITSRGVLLDIVALPGRWACGWRPAISC